MALQNGNRFSEDGTCRKAAKANKRGEQTKAAQKKEGAKPVRCVSPDHGTLRALQSCPSPSLCAQASRTPQDAQVGIWKRFSFCDAKIRPRGIARARFTMPPKPPARRAACAESRPVPQAERLPELRTGKRSDARCWQRSA